MYGVEPICRVLRIAPDTYYRHRRQERDPNCRSDRRRRDEQLKLEVARVWKANREVYGVRKVWRQLNREGIRVARCTTGRLMKELGLRGASRGRTPRTTIPSNARRTSDLVRRNFHVEAPNRLWVADLTYVRLRRGGFVYVAFVIDAYSRRIVGWSVASGMSAELVQRALEQALWERRKRGSGPLIHHSDRGAQYQSIRYTERLTEAGIRPSMGDVGSSYDNALAETIIGLYKTEEVRKWGPRGTLLQVELATLEWVHWFNHRRLLEPIGDRPPVEHEAEFYRVNGSAAAA